MRPAVAVVVFGALALGAASAFAQAPTQPPPLATTEDRPGPIVQQVGAGPDGGVATTTSQPPEAAEPPEQEALDQVAPGDQVFPAEPPAVDPLAADALAAEALAADQVLDVSPDQVAAETYDDGYSPQAAVQFGATLDPYGTWIEDATYGQVWEPSANVVGADFTPYASGGHWVMTEFGWTWVSDWDWGWAPFHYGRWITISHRGWCWVPGTIWGPGWVSWRAGSGFVGWSPLPPRGLPVRQPLGPRSGWRFVPATQMGAPRPAFVHPRNVGHVFNHTIVASTVGGGPGTRRLASVAPRALPRKSIHPYAGMSVNARPWTRPGLMQPMVSYARPGAPAMGRAVSTVPRVAYSPTRVGRTYAPASPARTTFGGGFAAPRTGAPAFQGAPRAFGGAAPRAFGGAATRGFAPSQTFGSAPRAFGPPPRNAFAPGPRSFGSAPRAFGSPAAPPAPMRSFSAPGRPFSTPHVSGPAPRAFTPSAPSHFGSPGMGIGHGGGGRPFGGGGMRR